MYTHHMSKRLQVILDDTEMAQIREMAARRNLTVAAWVRQALRAAGYREPSRGAEKRIAAIRAAAKHSFPTAEIDEMLDQIEKGYQAGPGDR